MINAQEFTVTKPDEALEMVMDSVENPVIPADSGLMPPEGWTDNDGNVFHTEKYRLFKNGEVIYDSTEYKAVPRPGNIQSIFE